MNKQQFYLWYKDLFDKGVNEAKLDKNFDLITSSPLKDFVLVISPADIQFSTFVTLLSRYPLLSYAFKSPYSLVDMRMANVSSEAESLTDFKRSVLLTTIGLGEHYNNFVSDTLIQAFTLQLERSSKFFVFFQGVRSNVDKLYPALVALFKQHGSIIDLSAVSNPTFSKSKGRMF